VTCSRTRSTKFGSASKQFVGVIYIGDDIASRTWMVGSAGDLIQACEWREDAIPGPSLHMMLIA
jgi:hypothetical protein